MKKLILSVVFAAMLLITVCSANALTTQSSVIAMGSLSQEASNFNLDRNGEYVTVQVVFNTSEPLTLQITPVAPFVQSTSIVRDNINVSMTQSGNTITLTARIPEGLPAVNTAGEPGSFKVATLRFSDGNDSLDLDLRMQRRNSLEFKDVNLKFQNEEVQLRDAKKINDIKPDDTLTFDVEIENTFSRLDDLEISDVDIFIRDDGSDLDIDEEETIGTIREDDTETETLSAEIPDDIDDGTYDLALAVTGFDEYGARHGERMVVKVEIEKEKNEISLRRVDLSPESLDACETSYATLSVTVENTGIKDQDDAGISVSSSGLGYTDSVSGIELDEDDTNTRSFSIRVPSTARQGSYTIDVKAFYDDNPTDQELLTLYVTQCDAALPSAPADAPDEPVASEQRDVVELITPPIAMTTVQKEEPKERPAKLFVLLLALVAVLVLVITLFLIKK